MKRPSKLLHPPSTRKIRKKNGDPPISNAEINARVFNHRFALEVARVVPSEPTWLAIDDGASFTPDELAALRAALALYIQRTANVSTTFLSPDSERGRLLSAARDLLARIIEVEASRGSR